MAAETVGQTTLRAENVNKTVTGFALQSYVAKQVVMSNSSSAWVETYFKESKADLTASGTRAVKGIPRLAKFPYGEVSWTKASSYLEKYGMEGVVSWEDAITDNVDVIARTLLRIARAVVKAVDTQIWSALTENYTPSTINTLALATGYEWDSATIANRDPIQDILNAIKLIAEDNYDAISGEGFIAIPPKAFANLLGNASVRNAGQFYTSDVTRNGRVGRICGLNMLVSNSITADKAIVGVGKICGTWKEAVPLTVVTIPDPGVNYTIRAWEIGVCQLTNPEAICLITNTDA